MKRAILILALLLVGCGGDEGSGTLDVGGEFAGQDVPAHEIRQYERKPIDFCVGRTRETTFSDYDYQCEGLEEFGDCVVMEDPQLGNTFYCALCGLQGSEMICYMINREGEGD